MAYFEKDNLERAFDENTVSQNNRQVILRYIMSIKRENLSDKTVANNANFMRWLVVNHTGDLDKLTELDVEIIQDKINDMMRRRDDVPASGSTKSLYKAMFKRFLKKYGKLIKNEDMIQLADFEFKRIAPPALEAKDVLTVDEIDQLIAAAECLRDRALIAVLYDTGARVGEIRNCKIEDVIEMPHGYDIYLSGKTGRRPTTVYKYQQLLKQYMSSHPEYHNPQAPLFPTLKKYNDSSKKDEVRKVRPLSSNMIGEIVVAAAKRAGIKKRIYPHLLRHSQATFLAANNIGEQNMKRLMGWRANSLMPGTYTHLADETPRDSKLAIFGITVKEKEGKIVEKCPRCNRPITVGLKFCDCGMPITKEGMEAYHRLMNDNDWILKMIKVNVELGKLLDGDLDGDLDITDEKLELVRKNMDW